MLGKYPELRYTAKEAFKIPIISSFEIHNKKISEQPKNNLYDTEIREGFKEISQYLNLKNDKSRSIVKYKIEEYDTKSNTPNSDFFEMHEDKDKKKHIFENYDKNDQCFSRLKPNVAIKNDTRKKSSFFKSFKTDLKLKL